MSATGACAHFADELRGFALLGIVLVNAPFLGISSEGYTAASVASSVDRAAAFAVIAFAQAKFYLLSLLSLLFCGYGLRLHGTLGAAWTLAAGVAAWALLDLFSHAGLRRFPQGPFELLLRRMSHGRAAPAP